MFHFSKIARMASGMLSAISLTLSAQVQMVKEPLPLDGGLTGNGWQAVPVQTDFRCLQSSGKDRPEAQTEFRVAADADNLYISILCHESQMEKLRKSTVPSRLWNSDTVEIFLCPTGQPDEFYQFAVSAGNLQFSMFYGEAGNVRPDPYFPFWTSKVFYGKDHWLVQIQIPFSAFYMTRNVKWNSEWLMNIARTRTPVRERSSWSPLNSGFCEPRGFRKFGGFPKRDPAQDVRTGKAEPVITGFTDGVYSGPLNLTIEADPAAAGDYELRVEEPDGKSSVHAVRLNGGLNQVVLKNVEYTGKAAGKTKLKLTFKAAGTGTTFGRYYPIDIVYRPLQIQLTSPGYKRNFYPGQDCSVIRGEIQLNLSAEQRKRADIKVSLSGGGLEEKVLELKADAETVPFQFDSRALTEGGQALLTATVLDSGREIASESCRITRLKKNEGSMIWIENNVLIKNGKPWYPRSVYARGYLGSKAFNVRYEADDLGESRFRIRSITPEKLIRGIEAKEAFKDVKPCPELLEKIRKIVEKTRSSSEIDFYYICDEPEYRNISPVYLKYIYDLVSEFDPYHPLLTCTTAGDKYLETADIFAPHPYLNPVVSDGKRILAIPVDRVRNYLQSIARLNRPDKVIGFTGQFFSYKFSNILADYPTWEELESSSWSAIVHGSRLQFPYAYHDLGDRPHIYEGYRYFNQSIRALESLLLSNRKHPAQTLDPENMIDTLLVEDKDAVLLIVVNLKNGPMETVVSAEILKKYSSLLEFRGEGSREIVNGTLKLSLKPYECVILTSEKLDAGLKTRSQVLQEIADQEKARGARGNLLFEKGAQIEVCSSSYNSFNNSLLSMLQQRNKLFDGTLDALGWQSKTGPGDHWYEISFRKNLPKFSRICLHGFNMGEPAVKIWKFGEWQALTPKKIEKAGYSLLMDLGGEFKSVKIRFEFPGEAADKPVELYEIELFN